MFTSFMIWISRDLRPINSVNVRDAKLGNYAWALCVLSVGTLLLLPVASTASASDNITNGDAGIITYNNDTNECGIRALSLLFKLRGSTVTYDHIRSVSSLKNDKGYSIEDLRSIATKCSFPLVAERFDSTESLLRGPAITLIRSKDGGHYIVLKPVSNAQIQILDPPFAPKILDIAKLTQDAGWTGVILREASVAEQCREIYESVRTGVWLAGFTVVAGIIGIRMKKSRDCAQP